MNVLTLTVLAAFSSVFFQDDFNDGSADGWFTVGPSNYMVEEGRYHFSGGGAVNDATSYRGDLGEWMSTADYSMVSDLEIDVGTFGGMLLRYDKDGGYNLMLVLGVPQQKLILYRWHFTYIEQLDSHPMPVEEGKTYRIRFQCQGDSFAGRAWEPGEEEPEDWFVSATDTLSRPGAAALFAAGVFKGDERVYLSCYFDNVTVETPEPWRLSQVTWAGIKRLLQP